MTDEQMMQLAIHTLRTLSLERYVGTSGQIIGMHTCGASAMASFVNSSRTGIRSKPPTPGSAIPTPGRCRAVRRNRLQCLGKAAIRAEALRLGQRRNMYVRASSRSALHRYGTRHTT